jgi:LysM repeat protein
MKNIVKILIVAFVFVANQMAAQNDIYIKYDVAFMDKYQYKVENLSSQNFHIAYHIYTSANERIILNTAMNSYQELSVSAVKNVVALTEVDWNSALINEINNEITRLYLVFEEDERYQTYEVSTVILVEETDSKLMYSGPYYSYTFDKNKNYGVAEDLEPGVYTIYDETIFMTNNDNSTMSCLNQYSFIKIIKETHPKGSFTMIGNEDFTSLHQDEIMETCQSALYVDFVENIGITEERTKNGSIVLIGINDKPIQQYIMERCQPVADIPVQYNTTTVESNQPVTDGKPGLNFSTREDNTTKSGTLTATNTSGQGYEYEMVFEMWGSENRTTSEYTEKSGTMMNEKTHIVDNDETLYGISKRYGTTVKALQALNNLETADIFVTQVLIISEDGKFEY